MAAGRCDFPATVLKGVVEHDDGTAYFASLNGYPDHRAEAVKRGWIAVATDDRTEVATALGLRVYAESGLADLPKHRFESALGAGRAYFWDWSAVRLPMEPPTCSFCLDSGEPCSCNNGGGVMGAPDDNYRDRDEGPSAWEIEQEQRAKARKRAVDAALKSGNPIDLLREDIELKGNCIKSTRVLCVVIYQHSIGQLDPALADTLRHAIEQGRQNVEAMTADLSSLRADAERRNFEATARREVEEKAAAEFAKKMADFDATAKKKRGA